VNRRRYETSKSNIGPTSSPRLFPGRALPRPPPRVTSAGAARPIR